MFHSVQAIPIAERARRVTVEQRGDLAGVARGDLAGDDSACERNRAKALEVGEHGLGLSLAELRGVRERGLGDRLGPEREAIDHRQKIRSRRGLGREKPLLYALREPRSGGPTRVTALCGRAARFDYRTVNP